MILDKSRRKPVLVLLAGSLMASAIAAGCSESPNPVGASVLSELSEQSVGSLNARPGDAGGPTVGKQLFKFNVIATPKSDWVVPDGECTNNGHRIFFQRGNGNTLGSILWQLVPGASPNFDILDCDGTHDTTATVQVNEQQAFYVMVRLLGPRTSTLTLTCDDILTDQGLVDDLCVIGTENLQRKAMTKIMENIVENVNEGVLWTMSGDWRIFEVRIYEKLPG